MFETLSKTDPPSLHYRIVRYCDGCRLSIFHLNNWRYYSILLCKYQPKCSGTSKLTIELRLPLPLSFPTSFDFGFFAFLDKSFLSLPSILLTLLDILLIKVEVQKRLVFLDLAIVNHMHRKSDTPLTKNSMNLFCDVCNFWSDRLSLTVFVQLEHALEQISVNFSILTRCGASS